MVAEARTPGPARDGGEIGHFRELGVLRGGRLALAIAIAWLALVFITFVVLRAKEAWPKLVSLLGG